MGIFSIFNILGLFKNFNFSKFFNLRNILIILLVLILSYGYARIDSLKEDVERLEHKIEVITIDRDSCKEANEENINELNKIKSRYELNEKKYIKRVENRDKIIITLRKDLQNLKKKLDQEPSEVIVVRDGKIPIIKGKDIKDEEFKELYNSISTVGK